MGLGSHLVNDNIRDIDFSLAVTKSITVVRSSSP